MKRELNGLRMRRFAPDRVEFPKLSAGLEGEVTPVLVPQTGNNYILHYNNYSVVIHRKRRFAIYSAANVSFGDRYLMGRPSDVWRIDLRIPQADQVGDTNLK
jgi:endonuclease G, mitochondrial